MQRSTAVIYTLFFAGALAFVIMHGGSKGRGAASAPADAGADADADAACLACDGRGGRRRRGERRRRRAASSRRAAPSQRGYPTRASRSSRARRRPALPAEAPKKVRFGVMLDPVPWRAGRGADRALQGRRAGARQGARRGGQDGLQGRHREGRQGVRLDDLGYIPRGVLEPAPEYELFSLPKGGVSGPVDTPRGFWIARRIE